MPATTRERLETLLPQFKSLSDQVGDNPRAPREDRNRLEAMATEVNQLVALLKGEKTLTALSGSGGGGPFDGVYGDLGGTSGSTSFASKAPSLGAPGLSFTDNDVKALQDAAIGRKAVTVAASPMSSISDYNTTPWPFLRDMVRILDLIPVEATTAPSVTYYRGTTGATAAAAVAEGANKPESSPVWTSFVATVAKLAHYARVNDEVLADFGDFRNVIGTEMLAGLINEENNQLLNGTGVAPNLTGLLTTTGILTRAKGTDTNLDALFKAANDLRTGASFTEPDTIILHPTDFALVRLVKDTAGNYITGDPMSSDPARLWETRVLVTNRIAAGTAMVANLKEAARAYVRQVPTLEVAPLGGGTAEFIANQTLVRCEERLALAVVRPTAIVKVTGLA